MKWSIECHIWSWDQMSPWCLLAILSKYSMGIFIKIWPGYLQTHCAHNAMQTWFYSPPLKRSLFVSTTHRLMICKGELFPLFLFTVPNNNVCSFLIALRLSNLTRELMQLWKSIKTILIFVSHFVFPSEKKWRLFAPWLMRRMIF